MSKQADIAEMEKPGWREVIGGVSMYTIMLIYLFIQIPFVFLTAVMHRKIQNLMGRWFSAGCFFWLRVLSGLSADIKGEENLPPEACIIACNHQSAWETIFFAGSKRYLVSVMKKELIWVPVFGLATYFYGHLLIDRANRVAAMKKVITKGTLRLKQGYDVLIFPEGTRVPSNTLGRFSTGIGKLAIASNAPIMPVAHNAGLYWPRVSAGKFPGRIQLRYGKPIYPKGQNSKELVDLTRNSIEEMLAAMPTSRKSARQ
jgi:1-acyl-sn-glycerol-3-phosphate acyltransferase